MAKFGQTVFRLSGALVLAGGATLVDHALLRNGEEIPARRLAPFDVGAVPTGRPTPERRDTVGRLVPSPVMVAPPAPRAARPRPAATPPSPREAHAVPPGDYTTLVGQLALARPNPVIPGCA